MSKKGKRELIIEAGSLKTDVTTLKKIIETKLKESGVKYSEDCTLYFNTKESKVYCVTENNIIEVNLCS